MHSQSIVIEKENVASLKSTKPSTNVNKVIAAVKKPLSVNNAVAEDNNAQRELRKVKLAIAEKDRQLAYLEQQLSITQSRVGELEQYTDRIRRSETVSRRALSEKEASVKRQDVLLKQVSDRLNLFAKKEENKNRRNLLAKQEIQEELERVGTYCVLLYMCTI
jgi:hypothetical protein